ncbi:hypothetical protein PM082_020693 [Marasmius tenuissimus]|nr:hypothetical protein PM082_020693 [Marasmius tenuissimus]
MSWVLSLSPSHIEGSKRTNQSKTGERTHGAHCHRFSLSTSNLPISYLCHVVIISFDPIQHLISRYLISCSIDSVWTHLDRSVTKGDTHRSRSATP